MMQSQPSSTRNSIISQSDTIITGVSGQALNKARKAQDTMNYFVDNLNNKVHSLLDRRGLVLKGRYFHVFQQLNDTNKALDVYQRGIRNLERKMDENPFIRKLNRELVFYKEYSKILAVNIKDMDQKIQQENQHIAETQKIISNKKAYINEQNHVNLKLATQITKLRNILNNNFQPDANEFLPIEDIKQNLNASATLANDILKSNRSGSNPDLDKADKELELISSSRQKKHEEKKKDESIDQKRISERNRLETIPEAMVTYEQYDQFSREFVMLVKRNNKLKAHLIAKMSNFNKIYDLFLEAYHKYEDYLYRTQKVVHDKGLNGSLIFLLLNSKKKNIDNFNPTTIKDVKLLGKTKIGWRPKKHSDGETVDVMHRTFKTMIQNEDKKEDKVKEMVRSVKPEQMNTFTPLQIMGLILLKPDVIREVIQEFEEKRRRLTTLNSHIKTIKISVVQ